MTIIHIQATVEQDGEVHLSNLPLKRGQIVELHIRVAYEAEARGPQLTAQQLVDSDLTGIWQDRSDIDDSVIFGQQLRAQAERRER